MDPVDHEDTVTGLRLECLADRRRRHVLATIHGTATSLSLDRLARLIAARETARTVGDVQPAVVDEVKLTLWHIHLPKLEAAGLIEFDRVTKTVAPVDVPPGEVDWPDTSVEHLEVVLEEPTASPVGEHTD